MNITVFVFFIFLCVSNPSTKMPGFAVFSLTCFYICFVRLCNFLFVIVFSVIKSAFAVNYGRSAPQKHSVLLVDCLSLHFFNRHFVPLFFLTTFIINYYLLIIRGLFPHPFAFCKKRNQKLSFCFAFFISRCEKSESKTFRFASAFYQSLNISFSFEKNPLRFW